jgi:disulfide oxidoreductase YuzD
MLSMARKKQLSYTNVKKDDKKLDEKLVVVVGNYTFNVDAHFRDSKIMDFVNEFLTDSEKARADGIDIDEVFFPYVMIIMIKHFTNIQTPEEVNEKIAFIKMLVDNELFKPVISALPADQVEKAFTKVEEVAKEKDSLLYVLNAQLEAMEEAQREEFEKELEEFLKENE